MKLIATPLATFATLARPVKPGNPAKPVRPGKFGTLSSPSVFGMLIQWLVVTLALLAAPAYADDYADVGQLLRAGKLGEAMAKAEAYLATNPRDPQMRFLKGVVQRDSGKLADAIVTFTKLTEDYPELPEPYNNLAVLYAGQSQFDKARASLEMAIRTNPSYATAHENQGDVYAKLASQAYNKALQLDSANTAVPPKLALIRELFNPTAKGQRPAASLPPAATPPVAAALPATVPVTAPPTAPATPARQGNADSQSKDAREAELAVRAWATAWSAKNMPAYLGAYGEEFSPPANQTRRAWEEDRRSRITGKSSISVKLENLTVSVSGAKAVAKFRQDYKASGLAVSSRKTLDLVKTGSTWLIARESPGA